jgi:glutamyl-tRNA reductase
MVANRSFGSAVELARSLDGTPVPFERIPMYLPLADLVVGSSAGGVMLEAESVSAAMDERRGVAMFFIDLAVPRNFDAAINNIDNVYLYDIDDLTEVAEENLTERRRDAVAGEILVEEAVEGFWGWLEKLEVVPTIVELRELAESIRRDEVERTLRRMTRLSGEEREGVESMSRAIVNKLLHQPTSVLKEERSTSEESRLLSALQRLFRLGREG